MKTTREQINKYLLKLKNGEDCLDEFIDYSRGYMQYIAYKYLIDKSLIEDVIFMAYHRILQAINTFDKSNNGLAWIVKITQNEAYKLNRDDTTQDVSWEKLVVNDIGSSNEDDSLNKYDIERAIERLDLQEQEIIELKVFSGMTIREIAKQINIPKSTVSYILKQALKKLEKYLE